ncbi:MAG: LUD domain-containing protein [Clostridia bacterium]|nr:LUD domain-containing protein [Clostridia bacterium]
MQSLLKEFSAQAETAGAQVILASSPEEIAPILIEHLRPLGSLIALVDTPLVKAADLEASLRAAGFKIEEDGAEFARQADIGIVEFDYGIAETGTMAADATDLKCRLAAMLPLSCVALLPLASIRATLTQVIDNYLERGSWPNYLTLVTGPSRTADIERSLTIGVHGPERLLIIVVGDGGGKDGH